MECLLIIWIKMIVRWAIRIKILIIEKKRWKFFIFIMFFLG